MEPPNAPEPVIPADPPTRYLLLDTNIISRAGGSENRAGVLGPQVIEYLRDLLLKSPGWDIAISEITAFELYHRSTPLQEVENESVLSGVKTFEIKTEVLRLAARLGCFYKEIGIEEGKVSTADLIIASTSALTSSLIYTTNMMDFPPPFFKEGVDLRKVFEYQSKKHTSFLPTYILAPQVDMIKKYYDERFSEGEKPRLAARMQKTRPIKTALIEGSKKAPPPEEPKNG